MSKAWDDSNSRHNAVSQIGTTKLAKLNWIKFLHYMECGCDTTLKIKEIRIKLNGDPLKNRLDIQQLPTPSNRVRIIVSEQKYSTASPTQTHLESFDIAKEEFGPINLTSLKISIKELYNWYKHESNLNFNEKLFYTWIKN